MGFRASASLKFTIDTRDQDQFCAFFFFPHPFPNYVFETNEGKLDHLLREAFASRFLIENKSAEKFSRNKPQNETKDK